jgi:hypothetical protein
MPMIENRCPARRTEHPCPGRASTPRRQQRRSVQTEWLAGRPHFAERVRSASTICYQPLTYSSESDITDIDL